MVELSYSCNKTTFIKQNINFFFISQNWKQIFFFFFCSHFLHRLTSSHHLPLLPLTIITSIATATTGHQNPTSWSSSTQAEFPNLRPKYCFYPKLLPTESSSVLRPHLPPSFLRDPDPHRSRSTHCPIFFKPI